MERLAQTALVTGASGGIGYELARVLAENGFHLVLAARSVARLEEIAEDFRNKFQIRVDVIHSDLSDESAAEALYEAIVQKDLDIDVLINNAGVGVYGVFAENAWKKEEAMIHLNILSLTHLTKLFLRSMLRKGKGRILNVASTAAFQPGPRMAVYYASKAYVLHFSEALANELKKSGVTVTALCPGPVITGFQKQAGMQKNKLIEQYTQDARIVALRGFQGMIKGKTVVIPGARNKILAWGVRLGTRNLVTEISGWFAKPT